MIVNGYFLLAFALPIGVVNRKLSYNYLKVSDCAHHYIDKVEKELQSVYPFPSVPTIWHSPMLPKFSDLLPKNTCIIISETLLIGLSCLTWTRLALPSFKWLVLPWLVTSCYVIFGFTWLRFEMAMITWQEVTNRSKTNKSKRGIVFLFIFL